MTSLKFMTAINGELLMEIEVDYPYNVNAAALGLERYVLVTRAGHAAPLTGARARGPGTIKMMPRWERVQLRNAHANLRCGERRWYSEFMEFVTLPNSVNVPQLAADLGVVRLQICALVLQAEAKTLRDDYDYTIGDPLVGFRGRTWEGCVHAIRLRASLSHKDSAMFVQEFLDMNQLLLEDLSNCIRDFTFENHFR